MDGTRTDTVRLSTQIKDLIEIRDSYVAEHLSYSDCKIMIDYLCTACILELCTVCLVSLLILKVPYAWRKNNYLLTYLLTYLPTYLLTYLLTYLRTYLPTKRV